VVGHNGHVLSVGQGNALDRDLHAEHLGREWHPKVVLDHRVEPGDSLQLAVAIYDRGFDGIIITS